MTAVSSPLHVTNFIIHAIDKKQGANTTVVNEAQNALTIDEKVTRFAELAFQSFDRQPKGLLFAGFEAGGAKEVFQSYLSAYHTQNSIDFTEFSKKCARHLAETMKVVNFATGGFLIFAEAKVDSVSRLCVLLLSQELRFAVNEKTLTLQDAPSLNMERMGVGCSISLNGWASGDAEPVAYVRGNREVSDYFMRFVGAIPRKTPKDSAKELSNYTSNFLAKKNIDGAEQSERKRRLYEYCVEKVKAGEPIDLDAVSAIVYHENSKEFATAANAHGISTEFHVDTKSLKSLIHIEYKSNGVSLRIERSAVRDNIEVNSANRTLTIKNVDKETLAEINGALGNG